MAGEYPFIRAYLSVKFSQNKNIPKLTAEIPVTTSNPHAMSLFVRGWIAAVLLAPLFWVACSSPKTASHSYSQDPAVIARGNQLFDNYCVVCHNFRTSGIGPNLAGLTREVSEPWLKAFIKNPMQVIEAGDERGAALFERYKQYMPPFQMLPEEDLEAILAYMNTHEARPETPTRTDWGEPVLDPIPEKIQASGLTLIIKEFAQVPPTAPEGQQARINKIAPLPDGSGRLFVHDLRGKLYELVEGEAQLFLDLAGMKSEFIHVPGHGTGMGSFAFHPEYAENGLFYTTHTENPETSAKADFAVPDSLPVKVRWVLTEWKQKDPTAKGFDGTHRELMRIDMVTQVHGVQEISFNPLASQGEADYGLLYIGIGDGGSVGRRNAFLVQNKARVWGCILRIDPLGSNSENGRYGIPGDNPFVGEADALGEIYAMGFRNPHRFTWDALREGRMLASGIGQHFMEEVNLILPGRNYGWPEREGTYRLDKTGDLGKLYPLPADDADLGYTYPVAQFDHDEGLAICGGYVYQGSDVPELSGKYLFGEIVTGRLFMLDPGDLDLGRQTLIEEVALEFEDGRPAHWPEMSGNVKTGHSRIDFRIGIDADGELYLFTKANGKIFKVTGARTSGPT